MLRQTLLKPSSLNAAIAARPTLLLKPTIASPTALRLLHSSPSQAFTPTSSTALANPSKRPTSLIPFQSKSNVQMNLVMLQQTRGEANKQSMKPASVDYQHATTNAKEEAGQIVRSFQEIIAGGSHKAAAAGGRENAHHQGSVADDWYSITKGYFIDVPKPVMLFGLAGTIPYIGTALGTIFMARESYLASSSLPTFTGLNLSEALSALHSIEHLQITYGAIILSFLGALHWGMEFSKYGGEVGWRRLAVGTVPVLLAWPTTFLTHGVALAAQWASFTGVWLLDQRASSNGWTPEWYSTYRFYLSIIVGFSIIGTMTGTSYYGEGAASSSAPGKSSNPNSSVRKSSMQRLDDLKKSRESDGQLIHTYTVSTKEVEKVDDEDKEDLEDKANDEETEKKQDEKHEKQVRNAPDSQKKSEGQKKEEAEAKEGKKSEGGDEKKDEKKDAKKDEKKDGDKKDEKKDGDKKDDKKDEKKDEKKGK